MSISLRTRVLAWFVLLSAVLVVGYSFITAREVDRARTEALDASLASLAETVSGLLEFEESHVELDDEHLVRERFDPSRVPRRAYAILVGDELISASPGTDADSLVVAARSNTRVARLPDGTPVRVLAREFAVRAEHRRANREPVIAVVVVAEDLRPLEQAAAQQANVMVWLIPATLGFALLAGWFVASRIVKPLRAMADAAEQIEGADLSRRVPVPHSGDEVASLADTLNRAFGRLQAAFERQARFTADAAHELRTPVAVIRTHAEVALRQPRAAAEDTETLQDVVAASARMQETLEGLLLLARADGNRLVEAMGPVALPTVASEVARELADEAAASGFTIELSDPVPDGQPAVEINGHTETLHILLRNLVGNAIRHSGRPGAIRVSITSGDAGVELAVRDDGVGIPADSRPHLFDRFYRVDASRTRADGSPGGSGLGLAIVRTIADLHHADVGVVSAPDGGTTITVTFPRSPVTHS